MILHHKKLRRINYMRKGVKEKNQIIYIINKVTY